MKKYIEGHPHYSEGWNVSVITLIIGFYTFAVLGAFFPSWEGAVLAVALYVISGLGVTVWYHRFFTHGSFEAHWITWSVGAIAGLLSGEGPPIFWVAWHAKHHQTSDTADDPHSPHFGGFWHAHQLWMMAYMSPERYKRIYLRYTPRWMLRSKFLLFLNHSYKYWHLWLIALLAVSGYLYGGWYYLASFVGYGYFLRMILVLNATWSVNSLSHLFGSQPYREEAGDSSRNNWFVALITFGEGWHNNHHACPTSYSHGVKWWEFDSSALAIRCLWLLGLATNLKPFKPPSVRKETS